MRGTRFPGVVWGVCEASQVDTTHLFTSDRQLTVGQRNKPNNVQLGKYLFWGNLLLLLFLLITYLSLLGLLTGGMIVT